MTEIALVLSEIHAIRFHEGQPGGRKSAIGTKEDIIVSFSGCACFLVVHRNFIFMKVNIFATLIKIYTYVLVPGSLIKKHTVQPIP